MDVERVYGQGEDRAFTDSGQTWKTLIGSTANDGKYDWKVTGPTTTQARIRVSSVSDPSVTDASDRDFVIDQSPPKMAPR